MLCSTAYNCSHSGDGGRRGSRAVVVALATIAFSLVFWLLAAAGPALALDVGMSPARVEQEVEPGSVVKGHFDLGTQGDHDVEARLYLTDLVILEDGSFNFVEPGQTQYSASTWVRLSTDHVTVKPDVPLSVDYEIEVPEDAEAGGHYAVIFAEVEQEGEQGVVLAGRVGLQLLLTVPGDVTQHLIVGSITAPPVLFGFGSEKATLEVVNDGNVHAIPAGYMRLAGGIPAVDQHRDFERVTLLPGAEHTYEMEVGELPWIGRVRLTSEIKYGPNVMELTKGEAREIEVFVISWKVLVVLGLIIMAIPIGIWQDRIHRRRRARRQRMTSDLDRRVDRFRRGRRGRPKASEIKTEPQVSCVGAEDRTLEMNAAEFQTTYRRMDRYKNRRRTPALQE